MKRREAAAAAATVTPAAGSFLFDQHGKKYIDFVMGWCVGNSAGAIPSSRRRLWDCQDAVLERAL